MTEIDQFFVGTAFGGSRVRYVHEIFDTYMVPLSGTKGWTAAYIRNKDCVMYAVAFCHKDDRFEKAVGRQHANEKLKQIFSSADMRGAVYGAITLNQMIEKFDLTWMLSDITTKSMSMLDFKHAAIGRYIAYETARNANSPW